MQKDGGRTNADANASAETSLAPPVQLSLSLASTAAATITVMHSTDVAAVAGSSSNGMVVASTPFVAASPSASTGRFSVHVASASPTPIDSRRDSPQRNGQRVQGEAQAASNRVLAEAEGSRLDGQSNVADPVSPASASLGASQLLDAQSMASLASTQQSIANEVAPAEACCRRNSPGSSKRGSARVSPKAATSAQGSAAASVQSTPRAAASASRVQDASCVEVSPTPVSTDVAPALPNHLFVPEPAPLVEPDALALAILQKELSDLRLQSAADRKELDALRNARTGTTTLPAHLELPPPVQVNVAAPVEQTGQYAVEEQPAEDDPQPPLDSTLHASPPAATRSPFAAYPLGLSQPFYPLSAPLTTVPEVSVVAATPALYPTGALANFAGPRLLDGALPGRASGVHAAPSVFAIEYPLRSAGAHVTSKPLPDSDRPVFARGPDSAGFKPPPAWGTVEHRPMANGDDGDNSSRYLRVHGDADSSDVWTAAHTAPTHDELLYERDLVDPLCTPLHARERMDGRVNAALAQPPGRDW